MSQPPTNIIQPSKEIRIVDLAIESCGKLEEDAVFQRVLGDIRNQQDAAENDKSAADQVEEDQGSPNEAIFFHDDIYEIVADFKSIPANEIYCRVSEGCVEVGAVHKETQGVGANARHLDLQLTRLYQTPRAININESHCYLSSDGILFVTGTYKETMMFQRPQTTDK